MPDSDPIALRLVRCGGMEIAVPLAEHRAATLIATTAVQLVRHWGLVNARAVIDRVRALNAAPPDAPLVDGTARSLLAALPRTHWLDDEQQWFSFPDPLSRLATALDKIFATTPRVRFGELQAALAKVLPGARAAPAAALRRCLLELGHCAIDSTIARGVVDAPVVRLRASGRKALTRREVAIVALLARAGGELDLRTLHERARGAAVPRTTVNQLLKSSPLFTLASRQRVRLIGAGPLAICA